jgi:SAM-dependent methyltransferase
VRTARRLAAEQGLAVRFTIGDAERLPYPDGTFDAVSSAHGVVFAADHGAVARELGRVCRPAERLVVTCWRSNPELEWLMDRVGYARPPDADNPRDWRRPRYVNRRLGADLELEYVEAICAWTAESGEAAWRLFIESDGPARTGVSALSPVKREVLRRDWVDYFERYWTGGRVSVPRPYLLVLDRRRAGGRG